MSATIYMVYMMCMMYPSSNGNGVLDCRAMQKGPFKTMERCQEVRAHHWESDEEEERNFKEKIVTVTRYKLDSACVDRVMKNVTVKKYQLREIK